jgi:UDP-glucose 4-epimerase
MKPSLRVLITGGAGFIGARLARRLIGRGASVVVLDDLSAAGDSPLALGADSLLIADVRDPRAVARASEHCDLVLHLASVVGVDAVTADPERTGSVIRHGTEVVLQQCLRGERPVVFFSSSEVTDAPRSGPRAVYAEAKRDAEAMLLDAAHRVPVTIIRPFNIVGPGQSLEQGMVLPTLAAAARAGRPLAVHGDGHQERAFLHVDDLVDVMMDLLDQARGIAPPGGEVLEIGGIGRVSIGHVAERLACLAGSGAAVSRGTPDGLREDRPRRAPDLSALRRRIAFAPRRSLDDILSDVLARA